MKQHFWIILLLLCFAYSSYGQDDMGKKIMLSKSKTTMTSSEYRTDEHFFRAVGVQNSKEGVIASLSSEAIVRTELHKLLCACIDRSIADCVKRDIVASNDSKRTCNEGYSIAKQVESKAKITGRHNVKFKNSGWRTYTAIELSKSFFAQTVSTALSDFLGLDNSNRQKLTGIFTQNSINFQWEQELPGFNNEDVEDKWITTGDDANNPIHSWRNEPVTRSKSEYIAWIKKNAFAYGESYSKNSRTEASAKAREKFYKMYRKKIKELSAELNMSVTTEVETRVHTQQDGLKLKTKFDEDAISVAFFKKDIQPIEKFFSLKNPDDGSETNITVIVYCLLEDILESVQ